MTEEQVNKTLALVKGTLSYEGFDTVDLVIEVSNADGCHTNVCNHCTMRTTKRFLCGSLQAALEDITLKQNIFQDLEKFCSPSCILATNTSTIDLDLVGEKTRSQGRIIGAHFFRYHFPLPFVNASIQVGLFTYCVLLFAALRMLCRCWRLSELGRLPRSLF